MVRSAPRIDSRLVAALARLDRPGRSFAETNRLLGEVAAHLELPRPSYEQVRLLLHGLRQRKIFPGVGETLLEISFRTKPPTALLDVLAGTAPPKRPK